MNKRGFTLIEALAVIAILAALLAMVVPMVANRNATKPPPYSTYIGTNTVYLRASGEAAPTGQGLTDKANLIAEGWIVTTN